VDDENFTHLEINFDREFSDYLIPLFLHEVFILAFRECPIRGKKRRNEEGNRKKRE